LKISPAWEVGRTGSITGFAGRNPQRVLYKRPGESGAFSGYSGRLSVIVPSVGCRRWTNL